MTLNRYRYALWVALAVALLVGTAEFIFAPLHSAGRGQAVLGYVLGAAHLLNMPGFTLVQVAGMQARDGWTIRPVLLAIAASSAFWGLAVAIVIRFQNKLSAPGSGAPLESPGGSSVSRRELFVSGGRILAAAGSAAGSWGFFAESRWWQVTHRKYPVHGLSPGLHGLRIVQLTDIHHGAWMSLAWVRQIVDATNALAPDIVALTGDYVYHGPQYVRPVSQALAHLRPRVGVVAVLGNHDWYDNRGLTQWAFAREGLPLIDNKRLFVTPNRRLVPHAREGLCIAGVGDLWEDKCLYDGALGGVPGGMPRILLSHNPDVAEQPQFLESGLRVDLMLSGHTHGGQIRLPGIGAPVTNSAFGQKYAQGLVQGPVCPVYVSRGLGMTVMPLRLNVPPEIAVIELHCA
jgi:predicted MPP superfamily phosphohydrolase